MSDYAWRGFSRVLEVCGGGGNKWGNILEAKVSETGEVEYQSRWRRWYGFGREEKRGSGFYFIFGPGKELGRIRRWAGVCSGLGFRFVWLFINKDPFGFKPINHKD